MSRNRLNRRTFVTAAGTAGALALAGCADSGPGGNDTEDENETTDGEEPGDGNETENGEDETYTLTVTVEDDQGPVEGATVTLEEAGLGADGADNESENETMDNESMNESENETMDNESMNESDNETMGNESDNETTSDVGGQSFPMEDETDEEGVVEFEELEDGEYTVSAEYEGDETEEDVEIDGDDEDVTLTFGEGGTDGNETDGDNETGMDNESDDENST